MRHASRLTKFSQGEERRVRDWQTDWLSDQFQAVFWAAKRAMKEASDAAYGRHGVRNGQQFILMSLWHEDGLTPGEIARRLGLATPTVTKAATRMEAAGLVVRRPHPSDARLVRIHLSDRGRHLQKVLAEEDAGIDGAIMRSHDDAPRTVNTIEVASVDETAARVTAAGGEVVVPKQAIPGVGHIAYCTDPSGLTFGIYQADEQAQAG